jgi:hypothetical protein
MNQIDILEKVLRHGPEIGVAVNLLGIISTVILLGANSMNNAELTHAMLIAQVIFGTVGRFTVFGEIFAIIGSSTIPASPFEDIASMKRPDRILNYALTAINMASEKFVQPLWK